MEEGGKGRGSKGRERAMGEKVMGIRQREGDDGLEKEKEGSRRGRKERGGFLPQLK